ncbi:MAG TPA: transglycosylase domain-containing protein, partial [Dehalococcoidia bacterium]|nr:transglycosylase domain-containing protein [Dehalococcoidia bacterium]
MGKQALRFAARACVALAAALGGFALAGVALVVASGLYIYYKEARSFVPPDEVAVNQPFSGARIYDRHGELLYEFVDPLNGLRRPVPLDQVSPYLIAATIATEDANYFENSGLNVRGLARAAWENLGPLTSEKDETAFQGTGGSSITQQLAKNLYIPPEDRGKRSISRKIRETVFALELTRRYSKEQILEWYLNQINYGGIYYGVQAASEGYFGKSAKDLTLAEAALLAGIPQSPSSLEPVSHPEAAQARRDEVLELMRRMRSIQIGSERHLALSDAEIDAAKAEPVAVVPQQFVLRAPHFVFSQVAPQLEAMFGKDAVYRDGLVVTTSLDLKMQEQVQQILEQWIQQFEKISNSRNGASIVIVPKTGEIVVYIGSRDYYREDIDGENDNLVSLNSPGSSFKPFVYLASFLKLGWSPGTLLSDSPVSFRESNGTVFTPRNPSGGYYGPISIRNALGNSLNVPAFKTAQAVGVSNVVAMAKAFGFMTLDSFYGPSIAIGGVDIRAIDLAYGYAMLANGGVMAGQKPAVPHAPGEREVDPISILRVVNQKGEVLYDADFNRVEKQVVDPEYAYMITNILIDPSAQCLTFGCGGVQVPGYSVAVKTGTSEPYDPRGPNARKIGETWAFGYTPDAVVAIWAGNSDNSPITNIFSTSISFRAMRDAMLKLYGGAPQTPWVSPPGLVRSSACGRSSIAIGCSPDLVLRRGGQGQELA